MLIKPYVQIFSKIKVMGLGGGGSNSLNSMISLQQIQGVEFVAVNTDAQALMNNQSPSKVQIGETLPFASNTRRLRTAILAEKLSARGNTVRWWASAF